MKSLTDLLTMHFSETINVFYRVSQSYWTLQLSKSFFWVSCQQLLRFQVSTLSLLLCFRETEIRAQNAEERSEGLEEKLEEALQRIKELESELEKEGKVIPEATHKEGQGQENQYSEPSPRLREGSNLWGHLIHLPFSAGLSVPGHILGFCLHSLSEARQEGFYHDSRLGQKELLNMFWFWKKVILFDFDIWHRVYI